MTCEALQKDQIQIQVIDLLHPTDEVTELGALLSSDETKRAERYVFDYLTRRFIVCRGRLRQLLGHYLDMNPKDIRFEYTDKEKPFLDPAITAERDLRFNVSHSEELAVIAFAWQRELGIDVEHLERKTDMESIAGRYFAKAEFQTYQAAPDQAKTEHFFNLWTAKEAFIKAHGKGLSMDLGSFCVEGCADHDPKLLSVEWDPQEVGRWGFYRFQPRKDYIATLAYEAGEVEIICFDI